jgi:TusA-related sulfurtransferase
MRPGQILEVLSTDPRVQTNFPQILKRGRNRVIDLEENDDFLRLFIKRG